MIHSLFGIPFYSNTVPVSNDSLKSHEDWISIKNGKRTSTNKYLNDNSYYSNIMKQCVDEYLYDTLLIKRNIGWRWTTSWGLRHDPGHFSSLHVHGNAMFSCILYTKVPERGGGLIISKDSRPTWTTGTVLPDLERLTEYTSPELHMAVSSGYCAIFPAHVHHGSEVNEGTGSRYCIVGNVFLTGDMTNSDSPLSELMI